MAPLRPLPGKSARPPKSILKSKDRPTPTASNIESLFPSNKKDKRRIKHAHLISKVTKSATTKPRRRRPNKKLVTTLDELADALPNDDELKGSDSAGERKRAGDLPSDQVNVIRRKSLKSRPGAMKRKQKLDNDERSRFAKNMAQMAAPNTTAAPSSSAEKFRALRGFIGQTLEKRPEVAGVSG